MTKPTITDPDLKEFMDDFWRDSSTKGNGSTAAAIREERLTGQPVFEHFHEQKGRNGIEYLNKWLAKNAEKIRGVIGVSRSADPYLPSPYLPLDS